MRLSRLTHAGIVAALGLAAGACHGRQPAQPDQPSAKPVPTDAWIGKWVGVEGLALDIQPRGAAGRYRLYVTLMDGSAAYAGTADGAVIRFVRGDRAETIRHVSGAETGLKWLVGKRDCLMIVPGEGFCRG